MVFFLLAGRWSLQFHAGLLSATVLSVPVRLPALDVHGQKPDEEAKPAVQALGHLRQGTQQDQLYRVADQ